MSLHSSKSPAHTDAARASVFIAFIRSIDEFEHRPLIPTHASVQLSFGFPMCQPLNALNVINVTNANIVRDVMRDVMLCNAICTLYCGSINLGAEF